MSVTWSLALAYFLFSFLNLFTSFACAILLGLGIDSGIHLFHKYRSLRLLGSPIEEALSEAYQRLHRSMIMATITTSFAFFALTLSGFKAIFQFGVIAGVGMIFCFISMVFIFPAIAYEFEKLSPIKPIPPKPRLINFNNLQKVILSRKSFIISSLIIACFTIPVIIKGVTFNYNFTEVMAPLNKKALNDRVDAIFSMTVNPQVARTENAQDAQALAEAIRQTQKINNKKSPEGSTIQTTISLLDFIPTGQEEKKRLIRQINAKLTDTVIKSLNENEKKWFQAFKEASNPLTFNVEHLPESILNKFRDLQGELGRYLYIFPNIDMSTKRFLDLVEELRSVKCDDCEYPVYFSGESIIFYEILHILTHQGPYVALASIVFVFIVLMLVLRNIRLALLVFSPIFLTLATLLGVMALFDLKFNVANLICVPLLIGAGIDYSIYLFQQYREANMKISLAYPRCASAILASAITTMIGFSALMMADNGGAYSVGLLTTLGILSCLFITLMWFTSLLSQDFKWTR
jgi:uncharacterized protein